MNLYFGGIDLNNKAASHIIANTLTDGPKDLVFFVYSLGLIECVDYLDGIMIQYIHNLSHAHLSSRPKLEYQWPNGEIDISVGDLLRLAIPTAVKYTGKYKAIVSISPTRNKIDFYVESVTKTTLFVIPFTLWRIKKC